MDTYGRLLGAEVRHYNRYPGWAYIENSSLRTRYCDTYEKLFDTRPEVTVIHAGLECGIIKEKLPEMDIISCGPFVENLHSPDERMNIQSFENFFQTVCTVITLS